MPWTQTLEKISQPADGRVPPVFKSYHVAVALVMIGRQQPLGRYELCENMSVGEGSVRTLLKRLTEEGYVQPEGKQGQRLTQKGQELFNDIIDDVPFGLFLNLGKLVVYEKAFANLVRQRAHKVGNGIRQRDEAVIQGGHARAGATTIVQKNGALVIPPDDFSVISRYQDEAILVAEALKPEDGDVVVIGTANNPNLAREVSMAAVMTLFEEA